MQYLTQSVLKVFTVTLVDHINSAAGWLLHVD